MVRNAADAYQAGFATAALRAPRPWLPQGRTLSSQSGTIRCDYVVLARPLFLILAHRAGRIRAADICITIRLAAGAAMPCRLSLRRKVA